MVHSEAESKVFVEECRYALDQFFQTLEQELQTIKSISRELAEIEQAKQILTSMFIDQDQWSVNANYYYLQYQQKIRALTEQREGILQQQERQQRAKELLARSGATEESIAILASAVLQIAKQCLSFRFGKKPTLKSARQIGTQSVVEIIWEGRNHGMHWEDETPRRQVVDMLQKLKKDTELNVIEGKNNAFVILVALDWKDTDKVIKELKQLVSLSVS